MRPTHALPVALLAAAAIAGCGGSSNGGGETTSGSAAPPATTQQQTSTQTRTRTATTPAKGPDGAEVFASAGCASCHTLAAADAHGNVGPNLDDLQPSEEAVKSQVENGGGGMPSFSGDLSAEEIDAVARYVSDDAGQ